MLEVIFCLRLINATSYERLLVTMILPTEPKGIDQIFDKLRPPPMSDGVDDFGFEK